jgi:hypothetical protein
LANFYSEGLCLRSVRASGIARDRRRRDHAEINARDEPGLDLDDPNLGPVDAR